MPILCLGSDETRLVGMDVGVVSPAPAEAGEGLGVVCVPASSFVCKTGRQMLASIQVFRCL